MKDSAPLISVIVAAHNEQRYILQAIESIRAQTVESLEILIVDDGSTDDTPRIVTEIAKQDSRITLIRSSENVGAAGSRNRGLAQARGSFVAIMDADDIADARRFEKQARTLTRHPEVFLVSTDMLVIDRRGRPLFVRPTGCPTPENIYNATTMWRNSGIYYYRDRFRVSEDYDLLLRMEEDGCRFANIGEPLLKYRVVRGSVSHASVSRTIAHTTIAERFRAQRAARGRDDYELFDASYLGRVEREVRQTNEFLIVELDRLCEFRTGLSTLSKLNRAILQIGLHHERLRAIARRIVTNLPLLYGLKRRVKGLQASWAYRRGHAASPIEGGSCERLHITDACGSTNRDA